MENRCISIYREDHSEDFIYNVLNQFSRWGINEDYIFILLERCADDIERLDIIESCLTRLEEFQVEPEAFLSRIACNNLDDLVQDASIAVESKELLKELDELRDESTTLLFSSDWAA
jgi:hypothetical protein